MHRTIVALVVAAAVAAAAGCSSGDGEVSGAGSPASTRSASTPSPTSFDSSDPDGDAVQDTTPPPPTLGGYDPKPADFELTVKVLRKTCFGSAGCNVTYRVQLGYSGEELDPSTTYEVTYEVRGPEDGAQVNTLEVTGTDYTVPDEELATVPSASTKLRAVVTSVEEA